MNILFGGYRSDKPRRLRVIVEMDKHGSITYLPQAKYFLFWMSNFTSTRSPKKLMWAMKGLGVHLDEMKFVPLRNAKVNMDLFRRLQLENDYFPHKPPQGVV